MVWTVLAGLLGVTVASGAVLGAALGLTGFAILHFYADGGTQLGVQAVWNVFNDFTLTAIPLFILLGDILVVSGLAGDVYKAMAPVFARMRGGLLHTNIAVCTVFGAVSGSSISVAALAGSVAYPELAKRGYDRAAGVGSLAGGGTLGLLIPPSLSLLIYGAITETSVGRLFLAGVVPGLAAAMLFMAWIWWSAGRNPALAPEEAPAMRLGRALVGMLRIWPLLLLIAAVLGTLFAGIATPTEAAGAGVAAAVLVGAVFGSLTLAKLGEALMSTVKTFAVIAVVFMGAIILAQSISVLGLPQQLLRTVSDLGIPPPAMLALVVLIYLGLGCLFDGLSMMIMTLPVVFPLLTGLGYDPVWLGVVVTIMIEVGMLTPPVGMNLFVLVGISGNSISLGDAARAALPYWLALMALVAIMVAVPGLATCLPDLVMGKR